MLRLQREQPSVASNLAAPSSVYAVLLTFVSMWNVPSFVESFIRAAREFCNYFWCKCRDWAAHLSPNWSVCWSKRVLTWKIKLSFWALNTHH